MDKLEFLGEIDPLTLNGSMQANTSTDNRDWIRAFLFDPRILLIDNIPFESIDLRSLCASFKIEYLHINYNLPTLTQVPQSQLELLSNKRDSTIAKEAKTTNFKRTYNSLTPYASEITLSRERMSFLYLNSSMPTYMIPFQGKKFREMIKGVNFNNDDFLRFFPNTDNLSVGSINDYRLRYGNWAQMYPGESRTLEDYPINEYLYNGGLPGFLDLIPYLIHNGNLIFNNLDYTIFIESDICKTGNRKDKILINGGYSGTCYFKERQRKIIFDVSNSIFASTSPTQILPGNDKRALIFVTNNTDKKLHFGFSNNITLQSPYLNSGGSFVWEHGAIINLDGDMGISKYDKRSIFGLPLWVKSQAAATGNINCEQYIYDY